jgi:WD40 repeat protein
MPPIAILTRGWAVALAALAVGGALLVGPPRPEPAQPVELGSTGGVVRALTFEPGGAVSVAVVKNGSVLWWRVDHGRGLAEPAGPGPAGFASAFAPGGAALAVGGQSTLTFWDDPTGGPRPPVPTESGWTSAVAFSPDGATLALANQENGISLWDPATARVRARLPTLTRVISLAFTPDGRSLATGGSDGLIRVWDVATGRCRVAVRALGFPVWALAFSDDGRVLASACLCEQVARLWDANTGQTLGTLRGHEATVYAVAFAPGGARLATTSADGTVRLWDVATCRPRATLRGQGIVACNMLAFSPDGRSLAAGGVDPLVWVWDVSAIPASS